jgi:hypothetical protein
MQVYIQSRKGVAIAAVLAAVFCQYSAGQAPEASKGLPPRATPGDYQAHAQAGKFTLAAEFAGHSVPDPQTTLTTEDYVVVEVGLFGPPESRLALSYTDFSLRINGKKTPSPAKGYELVFKSLKDPNYEPPELAGQTGPKSKTAIDTGGGGGRGGGGGGDITNPSLPPIVHIPIAVSRGWEQRVQKASLPEGERPLPAAGLIFFDHRGKATSLELIYNGPAGKVTIPLQP